MNKFKDFLIKLSVGLGVGGTILAILFGASWLLINYGWYFLGVAAAIVFGVVFYQLGDSIVTDHRNIKRRQQRAREVQAQVRSVS